MDIIVSASYIIQEDSSMDGIDDWLNRTLLPGYLKSLEPQSTSRFFELVFLPSAHKFSKIWVALARTGENVCYDVTSISSYSRTITNVEYGYNHDSKDLVQFNIGMFCNEDSKIPLYFNPYNGSLTDKTKLLYVLGNVKTVGLKDI